jgi:hypothetical protein
VYIAVSSACVVSLRARMGLERRGTGIVPTFSSTVREKGFNTVRTSRIQAPVVPSDTTSRTSPTFVADSLTCVIATDAIVRTKTKEE